MTHQIPDGPVEDRTRYGAGPDAARDARVAARRAADAARYGRALDRIFDQRAMHDYASGWQDGYSASEEHHNGHYGVSPELVQSVVDAIDFTDGSRAHEEIRGALEGWRPA